MIPHFWDHLDMGPHRTGTPSPGPGPLDRYLTVQGPHSPGPAPLPRHETSLWRNPWPWVTSTSNIWCPRLIQTCSIKDPPHHWWWVLKTYGLKHEVRTQLQCFLVFLNFRPFAPWRNINWFWQLRFFKSFWLQWKSMNINILSQKPHERYQPVQRRY